MTDTLTPAQRSERMSRIGPRDSKPELVIRRLVHSLGYRYRLHSKKLPGTPDLVFRGRKKIIFVHGCFWHRHAASTCALSRLPNSTAQRTIRFSANVFAGLRRDTRGRSYFAFVARRTVRSRAVPG
ncbi:MAG: hypothetical protein K2R98_24455, partial [Gemmataceae bacterium]|nr:hypothetical protein [Gemmataceae bacterium]